MWPFNRLSKWRKSRPTTIGVEEFIRLQVRVEAAEEALTQFIEDGATINTAINRIERKQNRWIEILNLPQGSMSKLPSDLPPAMATMGIGEKLNPGNSHPAAPLLAGEPEEE